jgi:hypothetical protein
MPTASIKKNLIITLALVAALLLPVLSPLAITAADAPAADYNWIPMDSGVETDLYGVWGFSDEDVYAVGANGTALHYDGRTWSPLKPPSTQNLNDIWGASPTDLYVVGDNATILMYDGQGDWDTKKLKNNDVNLYGVWGSDNQRYIVGWGASGSDKDQVVHHNGYKWLYLYPGTQMHMSDVWSGEKGFIAPGWENRIMEYTGYWDRWKLGGNLQLFGIWGNSETSVFAVGEGGVSYRYDGKTWQGLQTGISNTLRAVGGGSPRDVYAVGEYGAIIHYDGDAWTEMDSGIAQNLYGVWGSTDGGVFAVGENGLILCYHPPALTGLSQSQVYQGNDADIVISGYGLDEITSLDFGTGITVNSFRHDGDREISVNISVASEAVIGWHDVLAERGERTLRFTGGLEIIPPPLVVNGLKPDRATLGTNVTIRVSGKYFTETIELDFGAGIEVSRVNVVSRELLEADLILDVDAVSGSRDITFSRTSEALTLTAGFTVIPPPMAVTDITPRSAEPGQELTLTISGENLDRISGLSFGAGIEVISFNAAGDGVVTVTISIAGETPPADREVLLLNDYETLSLSEGFSVIAPSIPIGTEDAEEVIKIDRRDPVAYISIAVGALFLGTMAILLRRQTKAHRPPPE